MMNAIPASVLQESRCRAARSTRCCRICVPSTARPWPTRSSTSRTSQQREWLREYIESGMHRRELTPQRKVQLLQRLTKVETMERYFRKQFMSQKTFSIEGLDVMVPILEEISGRSPRPAQASRDRDGASRPPTRRSRTSSTTPTRAVSEFEAGPLKRPGLLPGRRLTGRREVPPRRDRGVRQPNGTRSASSCANNPRHLEAVEPVVEGMTRAPPTRPHRVGPRSTRARRPISSTAMPRSPPRGSSPRS